MEYNLKPTIAIMIHIDDFAKSRGLPQFVAGAKFMWIIYQRTQEVSYIKTELKDITSISEISFCLN